MKIKKNLLLIVLIALLAFEFQSCKNEAPVQTGQPNPPTIPTGPALVSPVNESIVLEFNIPFTWQSFASASSYRFMISQDANFATGPLADTSGLTTTSYTTHNVAFATGIYYYWRVIASTPSGNSPWSVVWRYRIVLPPPPAPILSSPDSGAINQAYAPLFTWNAAPTADFYRIQVSASAARSVMLSAFAKSRFPASHRRRSPLEHIDGHLREERGEEPGEPGDDDPGDKGGYPGNTDLFPIHHGDPPGR